MKIQRFSEFITEKVYLSKTLFKSYQLIVDPYSKVGKFIITLNNDVEINLELEMYGTREDKELIIRYPNIPVDNFKDIVDNILYILNKNQLNISFKINEIEDNYITIKSNVEIDISDVERIAQTTKIINSKIKDIGNYDELIYQVS
jgi:hypothetical protein